MIKRLSTAAIGVALCLTATSVQAAPYFGFDGRSYGEIKLPNYGRPHSQGPRIADGPGAPRKCLTSAVREVLDKIEARFGPVKVISTCRPGARIAGSGRISRHASGNAVDFEAGSRKGAIIDWLVTNHKIGGTMTYADMSHIHVDVGQHFVSLAGGRKYAGRSGSSSRRYAEASTNTSTNTSTTRSSGRRYAEGYGRSYERYADDGDRSYGGSRRYAREVSYERGYGSSYGGAGNSDYRNGYATIYH